MKKYLSFAVWCSCLLAACTSSPQYNLTGTLTGIQSDTLLVRSFAINPLSRPQIVTDTVPLKDGKFALQLGDSVLKQVEIMENRPWFLMRRDVFRLSRWMPFLSYFFQARR